MVGTSRHEVLFFDPFVDNLLDNFVNWFVAEEAAREKKIDRVPYFAVTMSETSGGVASVYGQELRPA